MLAESRVLFRGRRRVDNVDREGVFIRLHCRAVEDKPPLLDGLLDLRTQDAAVSRSVAIKAVVPLAVLAASHFLRSRHLVPRQWYQMLLLKQQIENLLCLGDVEIEARGRLRYPDPRATYCLFSPCPLNQAGVSFKVLILLIGINIADVLLRFLAIGLVLIAFVSRDPRYKLADGFTV